MRLLLRILAIVYIAYLALTVLVLLPVLNFVPHWYVKQAMGRDLRTEIILYNPFTLALEVRGAELPERNGERFADLDVASVNLSLKSLWHPGWVFDALQVKGLFVHVRQVSQGTFNFSDMLAADEADAPPEAESDGGLPGLTIHDLDFHSEMLRFSDETRAKPYSTHWDGLAIRVKDLSTVHEEGRPYSIDVTGEAGGRLRWEGEVSVPDARSEGRLTITDLSLRTMWRFAEPWLEFELKQGTLGVQGRYRLDWGDTLRYQITEGRVRVGAIDIVPGAPAQLPDTALGLGQIDIAGIAVDSTEQHASIETVTVEGLAVAGWSEGERVSLAELFATADDEAAAAPASGPAPPEDAAGSSWTASIGGIRLRDNSLRWRSEFTDPPLLEVTPIEASIENISWPLSGDSPLSLQLSVNGQAGAAIDGSLALASGEGNIDYQLQGLPLPWFNPNLPAALKATLTGGLVEVDGRVALSDFIPTAVALDGAIRDFSGGIRDEEASLTSWETVRWEGLAVDMEGRSVALQKLAIDNYSGRLHIREDGSINAQNVWQEEVGEQAEELAEDLSLDEPWAIDILAIRITDSEIDFMDESLPIHFRSVIGDLNGEVLGLSTTPGAAARVDITGSVDGYAPVALLGTTAPFAAPPALDLKLTFDGVDLALLTPYSGTYAGYAIDRGLLNLNLQYALQQNRLEGHNEVRIDQLKLGERVDSDKAVDVPLQLALALLTDSNGVIDMQVPVSGDVDDPEFDIGSVIAGAFLNLITKAVTAPFSLLAGLVSSEQDLQRLTFTSGSAELDEANRAKLAKLSDALTQRPALTLVINGRLNLSADRERLQKNILKEQLVAGGLTAQEVQSKGPAWEKAIRKRYESLPRGTQEAGLSPREEYLQVVQSIPVSDAQLLELAEQRALAIKSYLVNEAQLEADRAVIEKVALDEQGHIFSGVELGVGT